MFVVNAILHALQISLFMLWEVLWPLAFGFLLSAMIQTVVSKRAVAGALGKPDLKGFVLACGFGAASSSCSYAAVAVGRALFRRGASLVNAIIFEFASTNLVFELGLVLLILLGWQFVAAEFAGGLLMAVILWILFKVTLRQRMVDEARRQAERGVFGSTHEAHGEMDMSITDGRFLSRVFSPRAFTAISHTFFMDLKALYVDIGLGFLIAGALAAWVPNSWWQAFFLTNHPALNEFWSPLIGPVISMLSFVCSVGNVPLAVVLWNGGISFGGVISFIFADLIILPILNIYRKYYGGRTALYLLAVSYAAMALAGFLIGGAFQLLGLAPTNHHVAVFETQPSWNYTSFLDVAFLVLMAVLAWRFVTTGGIEMLRAHARRPEAGAKLVRDPVCGMSVDPATSDEKVEYMGASYYFCSAGCRSTFEKDPARYTSQVVQVEHAGHLGDSRVMAARPGGKMELHPSAIDPVCGMSVDPGHAEYRSFQKGETYYFCSAGCKEAFDKDPGKYINRRKTGAAG
ncbi:MAG: YHS domain-containing protein [Chloroflexi bacterium]|nr:MAG: YHS domain-containing protein [Chloroflexota bacterium]